MNDLKHNQKHSRQGPSNYLPTRIALRINAFSCVSFGLIFILFASNIHTFLGALPEPYITMVGVGLILHGAHLLVGSMRTRLNHLEIYYFALGDLIWFLGTLFILATTDLITSHEGVLASLLVAVLVLAIGVAQIWTYSEKVSFQNSGRRDRVPQR